MPPHAHVRIAARGLKRLRQSRYVTSPRSRGPALKLSSFTVPIRANLDILIRHDKPSNYESCHEVKNNFKASKGSSQ